MKRKTIYSILFLLILVSVISCSGSSDGKSGAVAGVTAAGTNALPAKRLIEVLSPADNASFICSDKITFSVTQAAGLVKIDSVQLWVGGSRKSTIYELPASVELEPAGKPGRLALRVVAFSPVSKPQTVSLFVSLLSDITPVTYRYKVVKSYPHDRHAYTQGLVYDDGYFYEGTGQQGQSTLRKVEAATGKVVSQVNLEGSLFGEGVALLDDRIYQLTWTTKVGFVYDKKTLTQLNKIYYQTQGWGLTTMDNKLVMSDGTNVIRFLDADFNVLSSVEVWDNKGIVDSLNELEMIDGELWANIWQTDHIARIDPMSGKVLGYVELANILPREDHSQEADVLNGIAWDAANKRLFVTGKYWPRLFEITVTASARN
jgi:glutamine cyclotransferase